MFYHAASAGALDLRKAVEEVITSFRRAGEFIFDVHVLQK